MKDRSHVGRIGRRAFLRGAGGAAVGLPFLLGLERGARGAEVASAPKRLVIVHHGQGTLLEKWVPTTVGRDYELSPLLEPLAAHRDRMLVVSGVSNRARRSQHRGNGHIPANRSLFTATPFASSVDDRGEIVGKDDQVDVDAPYGPSFEQLLAARLNEPGQRGSMHLAVTASHTQMWWRGAPGSVEQISPEIDPSKAFSSIFGNVRFPGDEPREPTRRERLRERSPSVLDRVASSYERFKARLPVEDREAMDRHAAQIRSLEQNLSAQIEVEGACARPSVRTPEGYNPRGDRWDNLSADNHIELLTMALACDVTRVVTLEFGNSDSPTFEYLPDYRIPLEGYKGWHDMVHGQGSWTAKRGLFQGFEWYSHKVSQLIDRLASTPDGEGTLLDNTLVLWISEFGNGGAHSTDVLPIVTFGSLGGKVRTGEHIYAGDRTTNDLYIALLRLFGGSESTFGLERGFDGEPLVHGPLEIAV